MKTKLVLFRKEINQKQIQIFGILLLILIFAGIFSFGKSISSAFEINSTINKFFLSRILLLLIPLTAYFFSRFVEKDYFFLWKNSPKKLIFYLGVVGFIFVVFPIIGLSVKYLLDILKLNSPEVKSIENFRNFPILLLCASIFAGVFEEIIFRGYLIPRLMNLTKNKIFSVIISSAVFALAHFRYGTLAMIINPFLFGVVLGILYIKYRNLKVLILAHCLWDISISFMY